MGGKLVLNKNRCILCMRCVNLCKDVAGQDEIAVLNRGEQTYIGTVDGRMIENELAGNIADICPVGALTNKDFRFKARPWELQNVPSVCPNCSKGCNIVVGIPPAPERDRPPHRPDQHGREPVVDLRPRTGAFHEVHDAKRISRRPCGAGRVAAAGVSWNEALPQIAHALRDIVGRHGARAVGVVAPAALTNEEQFLTRADLPRRARHRERRFPAPSPEGGRLREVHDRGGPGSERPRAPSSAGSARGERPGRARHGARRGRGHRSRRCSSCAAVRSSSSGSRPSWSARSRAWSSGRRGLPIPRRRGARGLGASRRLVRGEGRHLHQLPGTRPADPQGAHPERGHPRGLAHPAGLGPGARRDHAPGSRSGADLRASRPGDPGLRRAFRTPHSESLVRRSQPRRRTSPWGDARRRRAILHALPKTDLHVHLDGSLRPATLFDLAQSQGVALEVAEKPRSRSSWIA